MWRDLWNTQAGHVFGSDMGRQWTTFCSHPNRPLIVCDSYPSRSSAWGWGWSSSESRMCADAFLGRPAQRKCIPALSKQKAHAYYPGMFLPAVPGHHTRERCALGRSKALLNDGRTFELASLITICRETISLSHQSQPHVRGRCCITRHASIHCFSRLAMGGRSLSPQSGYRRQPGRPG